MSRGNVALSNRANLGHYRANRCLGEYKAKVYYAGMDEGRKRVIGLMAAILASLHMQTADDLFGGPQGSPRTDKLIAASIQWAERIMTRIDDVFGK
jgi:hypothetical protein